MPQNALLRKMIRPVDSAPRRDPSRNSGVFLRCETPDGGLAASDLAEAIAEVVTGPVVVLLEPSCGESYREAILPSHTVGDDPAFPKAIRLHAWLARVEGVRPVRVPDYVAPFVKMHTMVAIPIETVWRIGVVAVAGAGLTPALLRTIQSMTTEFALRLEERERRMRLDELAAADAG